MPSSIFDVHAPSIFVGGQPAPQLTLALLRWELVERPKGTLAGAMEVANTDAVQTTLASLPLGGAMAFKLGPEELFMGQLVALESQVAPESIASVVLRVRGKRPLAPLNPGRLATTLRVGGEVRQARVWLEGTPARVRFAAEATGSLAVGPDALRVGGLVGLEGLGPLFDGRFRLQEVGLRFDETRGLHLAIAGRR